VSKSKTVLKKIYNSGKDWNKSIIIETTEYDSSQPSYYIFERYEYEYPDGRICVHDNDGISILSSSEINVLMDLLKIIKKGE